MLISEPTYSMFIIASPLNPVVILVHPQELSIQPYCETSIQA